MSDIAKLGFQVDTAPLKKGEKALDSFAATGKKTEKSIDTSTKKIKNDFDSLEKSIGKTAAAQAKATKEAAKFSRASGQAGIQFQQFIGQVQGGQGVMLAFSQQSADLGFVLGFPLAGAISGIVASLIGIFLPTLLKSSEEVENLTKNTDKLIKVFSKLNDEQKLIAQQGLQEELKDQTKRFGELFIEIEKLEKEAIVARRQFGRGGVLSLMFDPDETLKELVSSKLAISTLGLEIEKTAEQIRSLAADNANRIQINETIEALKEQANLYGANERAIALYQASIKGASSEQLLAISSTFDLIDAKKQEAEATKENEALNRTIGVIAESIERQVIALRDGTEASLEFSTAKKLGLSIDEQLPQVIQKQIDALKKLKKERSEALALSKKETKDRKDLDSLTKQVENFGGTWSRTGSIIVDAFGDMSNALNDYMDRVEDIAKLEKRVADARITFGDDNVQVIMLQKQLDEEKVSAELSGLKSISSASASLFGEKTAAAKAFSALNKIIAITEIALSFQKMAASTTEAGVHVANETTKQGANALTAITSAFAAPFPINFVAGAAMIGIMAGLLGSVFGGGAGGITDPTQGRQEAQGTGTVLGSDDKSQSIIKLQERFEDLQIDQLAVLRGIKLGISSISLGISKLAGSIVVSGLGDFSGATGVTSSSLGGLFSKTTKTVIDEGISFVSQSLGSIIDQGIVQASAFFDIKIKSKNLFGLSSSTSVSTEFQDIDIAIQEQMAAIFGSIADTVLQSAQTLGFETTTVLREIAKRRTGTIFAEVEVGIEDAISEFKVNIGKISLEGLSGEEIEAELQAIFSQQSDLIAEFLVPGIAEFQKVGEGLFETLTRVTLEQAVFNDSISRLGFDLSALSNIMQIEVAQSVIDLTGGFENFADLSSSFFDNFFSDSEQFEQLENSLGDAFNSLGLSISGSKDEFRSLISGIDLTTESGRALFAALLELNPALSEFLDELERIERERVGLQIELLRLQGNAEEALAIERGIQLEGMDESLISLKLLIFAEEDRILLLKEQQSAITESFSMLEKSINLEKQRAQAILDVEKIANDTEIARVNDLRLSLESENELRKLALSDSESSLIKSFDLANKAIEIEKQRAQAVLDVASTILNAELSRISELRVALNDEKRARELNVSNAEKALRTSFKFEIDLIKDNANERIESLRDFSSKEIDLIQSNTDLRIDSLEEERSALDDTASSMRSLVDSINNALGLSGSNNLISALSSARLGDFSEAEKLDIGSLINLDPSGFSSAEDLAVQEAINRNRLAAISGLAGGELSEAEMMISAIDMQISSAEIQSNNQILAIQTSTESEILAIQEQSELEISELENQLNTLLNIDTSILSISDAIDNFNNSQNELDSLNYEQQQQQLDQLIVSANDAFSLDEQGYEDELKRLDSLIADNENQLNTLLGIDTSVLSVEEAIIQLRESQQELDNLNFDREIAKLDMLVESANEVFALHEQGYADELERLDAILEDNELLLNAALGIDASVLSVADAILALNASILELSTNQTIPEEPVAPVAPVVGNVQTVQQEETINALKDIRDDNILFQREIVKNTNSTARILQRIELNGLNTREIT